MNVVRRKLHAAAEAARIARAVREPVHFWLRLALRSRTTGRYRLRGSDVVVHVRHGTVDVITLDHIVLRGHSALPAPAAAALADAGPEPHVADLGANIGIFSAYVRRLYPGARITAFEPHPANVELLGRTRDANGGPDRWTIVAACADVRDGTVPLSVGGELTRARIDPDAADTIDVPAVDVFPHLLDVDLLKIDIEGAEWALLADERFDSLPARVVALEYHAHGCPGPDPAGVARARLREAGYETADSDFEAEEPGHGLVWGWRGAARHPSRP